jgi:hypothetical protein
MVDRYAKEVLEGQEGRTVEWTKDEKGTPHAKKVTVKVKDGGEEHDRNYDAGASPSKSEIEGKPADATPAKVRFEVKAREKKEDGGYKGKSTLYTKGDPKLEAEVRRDAQEAKNGAQIVWAVIGYKDVERKTRETLVNAGVTIVIYGETDGKLVETKRYPEKTP